MTREEIKSTYFPGNEYGYREFENSLNSVDPETLSKEEIEKQIAFVEEKTPCDSGELTGEGCDGEGTIEYTYVPEWLKGTAEAAGSDNGLTSTIMVCQDCYDMLTADDPDSEDTEDEAGE